MNDIKRKNGFIGIGRKFVVEITIRKSESKSEFTRSYGPNYFQFFTTLPLQHKDFSLNNRNNRPKYRPMHDDPFRQLLDRFNYSWAGYRKVRKGVKKRISRHMQEINCPNMKAYLNLLNQSDAVRQESERRMTVSISRFFRDRKLWHDLEKDILPGMIETEKKILRVWSAGCARGEEVYSFKIVWDRFIGKYAHAPDLVITATDIHPDHIAKARAGIYTKSSLKEVPQDIREHYFDIRKSGHHFEVKAFLKNGIDWKVQDIFADPPGLPFDIIFLRNNLLTYYMEHKKKEGLSKVIKALGPDGRLIVGSHEKMPAGTLNIKRHNSIPWAYRQEI